MRGSVLSSTPILWQYYSNTEPCPFSWLGPLSWSVQVHVSQKDWQYRPHLLPSASCPRASLLLLEAGEAAGPAQRPWRLQWASGEYWLLPAHQSAPCTVLHSAAQNKWRWGVWEGGGREPMLCGVNANKCKKGASKQIHLSWECSNSYGFSKEVSWLRNQLRLFRNCGQMFKAPQSLSVPLFLLLWDCTCQETFVCYIFLGISLCY